MQAKRKGCTLCTNPKLESKDRREAREGEKSNLCAEEYTVNRIDQCSSVGYVWNISWLVVYEKSTKLPFWFLLCYVFNSGFYGWRLQVDEDAVFGYLCFSTS